MKQLQQKHSVITGRGATAIYLALLHCASQRKAADGQQHTLLAPANVCYAALYPALYANWSVRLADVSPVDGNLTFDLVKQAFDEHRPDVLLVPHMYGQPVADMHRIQTLCHEQDVPLPRQDNTNPELVRELEEYEYGTQTPMAKKIREEYGLNW